MKIGKYIWKTKTTDYPVTVLEILGIGQDGRNYVKIAESNTAVPADELKPFENQSRKPPTKRIFS